MRAFVFTDPALASHAGQFVWLAVNTEEDRNAGFAERFALDAWPSFYVVDPADERVALRWVGAMTVEQVQGFLDDARVALRGGTPPSQSDRLLARADRLYGEGKNALAAAAYREALDLAPSDWPAYGRAVEALLFAYAVTDEKHGCVALSREALPRLRHTPHAISVSVSGLDCALDLPADPSREATLAGMEAAVRETLADPESRAAADDRSSGYQTLLRARQDVGDVEGARRAAQTWVAFLEEQAAATSTPEQRGVFDSHRLSAYLELGQPERAIEMLEAAERALPDDYNPPARLALAWKAMGRWDEALAASDRALRLAYGPRRVGLLLNRSDILAAKGEAAGSVRVLEDALAAAEALPEGERTERLTASVRARLEHETAAASTGEARPKGP